MGGGNGVQRYMRWWHLRKIYTVHERFEKQARLHPTGSIITSWHCFTTLDRHHLKDYAVAAAAAASSVTWDACCRVQIRLRSPYTLSTRPAKSRTQVLSLYAKKKSNEKDFWAISTCCWPELGAPKPSRRERGVLPRVRLSPCIAHQELGWVRSALRKKTGKHLNSTVHALPSRKLQTAFKKKV